MREIKFRAYVDNHIHGTGIFEVVKICGNVISVRIPDKEDMRMYLRPSTLFGPKFEGYLNQKGGVKSGTDSWGYKPTNKVLTAAEIAKLKDDESKLI